MPRTRTTKKEAPKTLQVDSSHSSPSSASLPLSSRRLNRDSQGELVWEDSAYIVDDSNNAEDKMEDNKKPEVKKKARRQLLAKKEQKEKKYKHSRSFVDNNGRHRHTNGTFKKMAK